MRPDEVARLHAERPGYELVDWAEVTLPIYKIYVVASLLQHTPLPPVYEFVLRAIRLGIDDETRIAECLGIPGSMIAETVRSLHSAEEIAFRPGADRFVLTRKGERTVTSLARIRPEQQTIPIFFDGLLRRPVEPPVLPLLSGRQAEDMGFREIPSFPAARVQVSDIDVARASRVLGRPRSGEGRKDLLAIKSIERRMRLHVPSVALVYRQVDGKEVDIWFASETGVLEDHGRAFERAEGAAKLRLLGTFARNDRIGSDSLAGRLAKPAVSVSEASSPRRRTILPPRRQLPPDAIETLSVLDHPPVLRDAIATARSRLLIVSPWITSEVVDTKAVAALRALLVRGCRLGIGYGLEENRPRKPLPPGLSRLALEFPTFDLIDFGNTHEKLLIKDDEFVVIGSYNWLSFRGDPHRELRLEASSKINDPAYVVKTAATLEARFRRLAKAVMSNTGG